ncbi:MAG: hypothetical protein IJU44_01090 [Kiritimatiellae bacterium]|nr:hypothetical protein [Kiritimatiellia bacterium]
MDNQKAETRCGRCGTVLESRHVNRDFCYCPVCRNFVLPLADGEKPALEEDEFARRHPPRGMSARRIADNAVNIREGIPWRFLWLFPASILAFFLLCWAVGFASWRGEELLAAFLGTMAFVELVFVCFLALCKMTAHRYAITKDALVITSLWLGFIPVRRRRLTHTRQTSVGIATGNNVNRRRKMAAVILKNGMYCMPVWQGRDERKARFIAATLTPLVGEAECGTPYVCPKCGTEIPDENIDVPGDRLTCPKCMAKFTCAKASIYKQSAFHSRFKPDGVEMLPDGFIYREGRWRNGEATVAWVKAGLCVMPLLLLMGLAEKFIVNHDLEFITLAVMGAVSAISLLYILRQTIRERFAIHRITLERGMATYYHGTVKRGKTITFPCHGETVFAAVGHQSCDTLGGIPHGILVSSDAEVSDGSDGEEPGTKYGKSIQIFSYLRPEFYSWALGWLYLAAVKNDE